ncbi:hypothetical protein DPMN_123897 [Dreissena polymorpha]|uniref:Uncharacterized protein n=1 Tax=Dreissena polymorpha TaxID=45954 RepID=A0A9D4JVR9_DREPO|nr:hypothetical protein DPMN_123897 [Dreissena polymorpha]
MQPFQYWSMPARDTSLTTCNHISTDPCPREIQASRHATIPVLIHARETYEPHDMQPYQYCSMPARDTSLTTCNHSSTDPCPREIRASRHATISVLIHARERYEPHGMQPYQY